MLKPQNNTKRYYLSLDGCWDFSIAPPDSPATGITPEGQLAVPASWNEQHTALYHYKGRLWYQTKFSLPPIPADYRAFLRFAGFTFSGDFFLNGTSIGHVPFAYLPVEFEITEMLAKEDNRLLVGLDGTPGEHQAIGIGDFYEYGGINRSVTVEIRPAVHIQHLQALGDCDGHLKITWQCSGGTTMRFSIDGHDFAADSQTNKLDVTLPNITPWSCECPKLYSLKAVLCDGNTACDEYCLKTGFRTVETRGYDILLNKKPIQLKGFGKHEDFHIIGKGVNQALNIRDFELMKWCGANSFRTSHYPYSEEILDMADEQGILVIDELPFVNFNEKHFTDTILIENALEEATKLIMRDNSHPAVLSWSIGNESRSDLPECLAFYPQLIQRIRDLDSTRPITYVSYAKPEEDKVYPLVDIIGLNRYYGWYAYPQWGDPAKSGNITEGIQALNDCLDTTSRLFCKPIVITEFGADCVAGFHSMFDVEFTEEFQAEFISSYVLAIQAHANIAGMHVWNFADFNTNQDTGRVKGNRKGVFSRSREPKAAAFVLRRLWTGQDSSGLLSLGAQNQF